MRRLILNKVQQQQFAQRMNDELERVTMSWDNQLREWHQIAIEALKFASPLSLNIPQNKYPDIFKTTDHGVNMNVVMVLCNNMEARTPHEMGVPAKKWADVLMLNHAIASRWTALAAPVNQRVTREFQIMNPAPGPVIAEA